MADRPDDFGGSQIHVIYMGGSPKGAKIDRGLDTNGALQTSIAASQGWLQGVTGKRLRIDTFQGAPDITYVQSAYDNDSLAQLGTGAYYWIEQDLIDHGIEVAGKYYLVYYDGDNAASCGSSSRPPAIGGHIAGVYLRGPNCQGLATSASAPGYIEMVALHEVFHMLGLVPSCAPNQISNGHVAENSDLMYVGGGVWAPSVVDVNHDDYWGHGRNDCPDGNRSALLNPQGPDIPPEGTRTLEGNE